MNFIQIYNYMYIYLNILKKTTLVEYISSISINLCDNSM